MQGNKTKKSKKGGNKTQKANGVLAKAVQQGQRRLDGLHWEEQQTFQEFGEIYENTLKTLAMDPDMRFYEITKPIKGDTESIYYDFGMAGMHFETSERMTLSKYFETIQDPKIDHRIGFLFNESCSGVKLLMDEFHSRDSSMFISYSTNTKRGGELYTGLNRRLEKFLNDPKQTKENPKFIFLFDFPFDSLRQAQYNIKTDASTTINKDLIEDYSNLISNLEKLTSLRKNKGIFIFFQWEDLKVGKFKLKDVFNDKIKNARTTKFINILSLCDTKKETIVQSLFDIYKEDISKADVSQFAKSVTKMDSMKMALYHRLINKKKFIGYDGEDSDYIHLMDKILYNKRLDEDKPPKDGKPFSFMPKRREYLQMPPLKFYFNIEDIMEKVEYKKKSMEHLEWMAYEHYRDEKELSEFLDGASFSDKMRTFDIKKMEGSGVLPIDSMEEMSYWLECFAMMTTNYSQFEEEKRKHITFTADRFKQESEEKFRERKDMANDFYWQYINSVSAGQFVGKRKFFETQAFFYQDFVGIMKKKPKGNRLIKAEYEIFPEYEDITTNARRNFHKKKTVDFGEDSEVPEFNSDFSYAILFQRNTVGEHGWPKEKKKEKKSKNNPFLFNKKPNNERQNPMNRNGGQNKPNNYRAASVRQPSLAPNFGDDFVNLDSIDFEGYDPGTPNKNDPKNNATKNQPKAFSKTLAFNQNTSKVSALTQRSNSKNNQGRKENKGNASMAPDDEIDLGDINLEDILKSITKKENKNSNGFNGEDDLDLRGTCQPEDDDDEEEDEK